MTRTALVAHNKNPEEGEMILTEEVKEIFTEKDWCHMRLKALKQD